jgi:hypothetical protein
MTPSSYIAVPWDETVLASDGVLGDMLRKLKSVSEQKKEITDPGQFAILLDLHLGLQRARRLRHHNHRRIFYHERVRTTTAKHQGSR